MSRVALIYAPVLFGGAVALMYVHSVSHLSQCQAFLISQAQWGCRSAMYNIFQTIFRRVGLQDRHRFGRMVRRV